MAPECWRWTKVPSSLTPGAAAKYGSDELLRMPAAEADPGNAVSDAVAQLCCGRARLGYSDMGRWRTRPLGGTLMQIHAYEPRRDDLESLARVMPDDRVRNACVLELTGGRTP